MKTHFHRVTRWLGLAAGLWPLAVSAQTLTITNGVQTYATLSATTVTMSNRCELRITSASSPISGCTINLNSSDAWLLLTGIKPSAVASTYLGQVLVNGSAAVADSNVRVVQYGAGAVVIPQPPSFQPLQVFSGPHFTGTPAAYSQYVYYTGTGLGAMDQNISSFKLKRGYMAVMAQNTAGNGFSQCYIAQDGDLEIGVLPAMLENHIRFIYVTPWRWVSKKGIAGNPGNSLLNVNSWYDWNIDQSSSRDLEYVPIRQDRWWPSLTQNWQTLGANTVLGYNEPDSATQANILAGDAIRSWPDLLGTGLRVGAPAVTDGGWSWITNFMSQADAAGLRVDFVPLHYYQAHNPADASGAATQMYNFLKARYDQFKRPLWVTEWNNGANWTDNNPYAPPTYAQQQACIAAMVQMLENAPFVERYQLYNWVEDVRSVVTNGVLTAAGVTYRDQVSALAYAQTLPDNGTRSFAEFLFETNTLDGSGYGNNALAASPPAYTAGHRGQAVELDGTNNYIQLPPNLGNATNFSFAAWVNWSGGANWQRIFDFGDDMSHYLFLTPSSGSALRFAINNGSGEQTLQTASPLPSNQWVHVCFTLGGGTGKIYTNGVQAAASGGFTITPSSFTPIFNYLGRSQFPADPLFHGSLDEVQVADYAFTAAQVAALPTNSPPQFGTNLIVRPSASEAVAYSNNITGLATDPDPGDPITYYKIAGPAWLSVSTNGILAGTPGPADGGTNYFTVRATDVAGASAFSVVAVYVSVIATNGVWIADSDGLWSAYANWSGSAVANGINQTADFSTINLTASRTVTLDSKRSIGTLKFGDTSGAQNWTLTSGGGTTLTLDNGPGTSPAIVVNQNTVTNLVSLAGTNGFTKSAAGTLILGVDNSLSGTLNVDSFQTSSGADGAVQVASPGGFGNVSTINIRNQNLATSALKLDGTNGNISSSASIGLNGRNNSVAAIENISGSNTLAGGITVYSGGGSYLLQSDAGGTLNLGGNITSAAGGTRTFTFQGVGDIYVAGAIQNGTSTNNFAKSGSGNLILAGANTLTGTNRIVAGMVTLANSAALLTSTLDMNAADAGSLSFGALAGATLGGLLGTRGIALTNTVNAPVTLAIGANGLAQAYTGVFSGSGNLVKTSTNLFTLSTASTFTGTTRINAGTLALAGSLALQNSTLDLNAADSGTISFGTLTSTTFGGLTGSRNLALTNNANAAVTMTIGGNGQNSGYAGVLSGSGSLVKTGGGVLALSSSNIYTGSTTVSSGTLKLSRDPIVKLSFDSVSGTGTGSIVTNSGTGGGTMNGTVINGATGVSFGSGKSGNALNLPGDGSYVAITNRITSLDGGAAGMNWTLAMWLKTTQAGAGYAYQGDGGWGSGNTAFYLNQGNTAAGTRVGAVRWGGGWLTGSAGVTDGQWHFIAIADNGGTKNLYIDGNLDATVTAWTNVSTGNLFWIGGTADGGDGVAKLNGSLDEVAIYNRALGQAEIQSLTNSQTTLAGSFGGQLPSGTALAIASGATFDLGGNSQTISALSDSGAGGTVTNSSTAPVTLTIAGNSGTSAFSGRVTDAGTAGAISLLKSGGGAQVLAGANNFRGQTVISNGTLIVSGSNGTNAVNVRAGTLAGTGVIDGPVTVFTGGTLSPGNNSIGALTISNSLALTGTNYMELNKTLLTNDSLLGLMSISYGGTLLATNLSGALAGGDSFKLFSSASSTGNFTTLAGAPGAGLVWKFNPTNGTLTVYSTVATNLTVAITNNVLQLSWPADHLGWRLQVQTNDPGTGLGTNWMEVPGSAQVNTVTNMMNPAKGAVFYRMIYP